MNDTRRKELEKAKALLEEAKEIISQARDEEQEYFDNMPESFQTGEKGDKAQSVIDTLDGIDLDDIISNIDEAMQ